MLTRARDLIDHPEKYDKVTALDVLRIRETYQGLALTEDTFRVSETGIYSIPVYA